MGDSCACLLAPEFWFPESWSFSGDSSPLPTSVTGGGLQMSYTGSSEKPSICLVFAGAIMEAVTMDECVSNTSTARLSISFSVVFVGQIYVRRSSLPQMMCFPSSLNDARI